MFRRLAFCLFLSAALCVNVNENIRFSITREKRGQQSVHRVIFELDGLLRNVTKRRVVVMSDDDICGEKMLASETHTGSILCPMLEDYEVGSRPRFEVEVWDHSMQQWDPEEDPNLVAYSFLDAGELTPSRQGLRITTGAASQGNPEPQKIPPVLEFFQLDAQGQIVFPPEVRHVVIDVGQAATPILPATPTEFVVGFEPIFSTWKENSQRHRRLVSINAAVGDSDRIDVFRQLQYADSSSLYPVDPVQAQHIVDRLAQPRDWPLELFQETKKFLVAVVRLEPLLRAIPPHINITHLKVDAQGADYDVCAGAGAAITRVQRVTLEVPQGAPVYTGAATRSKILAFMEDAGFSIENIEHQVGEDNIVYVNNRFR